MLRVQQAFPAGTTSGPAAGSRSPVLLPGRACEPALAIRTSGNDCGRGRKRSQEFATCELDDHERHDVELEPDAARQAAEPEPHKERMADREQGGSRVFHGSMADPG